MNRQPEIYSEMVKEPRKHLGFSKEELVQALVGVSFATIDKWENAKTAPSKLARRQLDAFRREHAGGSTK
ncbi:MAG: helix-turn-helix transcriptional regulator [Pseudomonadota bacterium]